MGGGVQFCNWNGVEFIAVMKFSLLFCIRWRSFKVCKLVFIMGYASQSRLFQILVRLIGLDVCTCVILKWVVSMNRTQRNFHTLQPNSAPRNVGQITKTYFKVFGVSAIYSDFTSSKCNLNLNLIKSSVKNIL